MRCSCACSASKIFLSRLCPTLGFLAGRRFDLLCNQRQSLDRDCCAECPLRAAGFASPMPDCVALQQRPTCGVMILLWTQRVGHILCQESTSAMKPWYEAQRAVRAATVSLRFLLCRSAAKPPNTACKDSGDLHNRPLESPYTLNPQAETLSMRLPILNLDPNLDTLLSLLELSLQSFSEKCAQCATSPAALHRRFRSLGFTETHRNTEWTSTLETHNYVNPWEHSLPHLCSELGMRLRPTQHAVPNWSRRKSLAWRPPFSWPPRNSPPREVLLVEPPAAEQIQCHT